MLVWLLDALADGDLALLDAPAAHDPHFHRLPDKIAAEDRVQVVQVTHPLTRQRHDRIAQQQPGLPGRAVRLHADQQQPRLLTQLGRQRIR